MFCVVLQLKLNRSQFTNWLCRQLTSSCKGKTPKLAADRQPGPPFTVMDEQQAQLQKMMAGMKVSGTHPDGGSRGEGTGVGKGMGGERGTGRVGGRYRGGGGDRVQGRGKGQG